MDRLFHIMEEGVGQVKLATQYPLKCNLLHPIILIISTLLSNRKRQPNSEQFLFHYATLKNILG